MVNGAPREVPRVLNGVPREYIEGPPRVFGLGSGLGGPSIFSLGTPLRTLGNLPRGSIHHYTPSAFPQIVPLYLTPCHKEHGLGRGVVEVQVEAYEV